MLKKIMQPVMALVLAYGVIAASAPAAEAGHGRGVGVGIAAGIIGLWHSRRRGQPRSLLLALRRGMLSRPRGVRLRQSPLLLDNKAGDYVCRGGRWTCWRPTYCD